MKLLSILLLWTLAFIVLASPSQTSSENASQPYQVAILTWRGPTDAEHGFMDYFREKNIPVAFNILDCNENPAAISAHVDRLREQQPDLIYLFGTSITLAVAGMEKNAKSPSFISDIPLVFNIVADPLGAGIVSDLSGSRRNLTGVTHSVPLGAQLAAMRRTFDFTRLGVIYNASEKNSVLAVEALERLLWETGAKLVKAPIDMDIPNRSKAERIAVAVETLSKARVDMLYLPSDSFVIKQAADIVGRMHDLGIPTFSATEEPVRQGGALMGMVSTYFNVGRFAAYKAEQILRQGIDPGRIPIERLKRFTFVVNRHAMRELDFYPPVTLLNFAQVVGD